MRGVRVGLVKRGYEQHDVALASGQRGQRLHQLRVQALSGHRGDDTVLVALGGGLGPHPNQRLVVAGFCAPAPGHQRGGDTEQPGPQVAAFGLEPVAPVERHAERLGSEDPQPPAHPASRPHTRGCL